jgi:hypothetical protein
MATTASSRLRAVERGKSPHKSSESSSRRRKVLAGPIDFEQRREHIKLAYTKSIRDSQVLEAQQQAAERRRRAEEARAAAESASKVTDPDADEILSTQPQIVLDAVDTPTLSDESGEPYISEKFGEAAADQDRPEFGNAEEGDTKLPSPSATASQGGVEEDTELVSASAAQTNAERPAPVTIVKDFDSPTLGLPGSFPAMSPPIDSEEPPMSAVSAVSDTTEFDIEPQTDLPVHADQHQPGNSTTGELSPLQNGDLTRFSKAEYQYPFEDSPDPTSPRFLNNNVAEADLFANAITEHTHDLGIMIPETFTNERSNGLGLVLDVQHDDLEPTITLDEQLNHGVVESPEELPEKVPFPRLGGSAESECQSDAEVDDGATDACTEDTDIRDGKTGYPLHEEAIGNGSSPRSSVCESIDPHNADDLQSSTHSDNYRNDALGGLHVPSVMSPGMRLSHQSTWTDVSVGSADPSNTAASSRPESYDFSAHGHATIYGSTRVSERESQNSVAEPRYSHSELHSVNHSARSSVYMRQTQLPEIDTGIGFSVSYMSGEGTSASGTAQVPASVPSPAPVPVPVPEHEPPPIPTPAPSSIAESRRPSSTFYEQSQNGSTLVESTRGSNDFAWPTESSQSFSQPLNASKDSFTEEEPLTTNGVDKAGQDADGITTKERHRLTQRRNIIKELVDTEAVFVRDMNIVEEIYKGTAEACPKLDLKTVKLIFRNTDEIIEFHTVFLSQLKEAVAKVYVPKNSRSRSSREDSMVSQSSHGSVPEFNDAKDRETLLGPLFMENMASMKAAHEGFLRNSDQAAKRLIQIQQDPTVKVWLNECNEVAKDLTAAWDLDSLLIKPMQRITKYPNLIITLLQHTPKDHPDHSGLVSAKEYLETAIIEINQTKKNFELVGQIVGRKRKESDVKAGFARAFGKRVDKLQASNNRPAEDPVYAKLNEKFGDDYLRLQVVLRDVEFYTRQVATYVHEFLQYLSSIELVMRLQPGSYPELESKWVQFNISVRDLEKVALEEHLAQVRKHVIEPFELVIRAYGNPSLAMKKRQKRRLDFERFEQLRRAGKSPDAKLKELVEQYEALNDTLKKELPQLSALTERIGNICLGNLVNIQTNWYKIWKDKMKAVLPDCPETPDLKEVMATFQRDFPYVQEQVASIGMLNPAYRGRASQSTVSGDESIMRGRTRPSALETRSRGQSLNFEGAPVLPTPDFVRRNSGSFTMSPGVDSRGLSSPQQYYYKDYYSGLQPSVSNPMPGNLAEARGSSSRSLVGASATPGAAPSTRPGTGWSHDSGALPRQSSDTPSLSRRDSSHTAASSTYAAHDNRRFSGLFQSALPLPDGPEDSHRSSRASSRERWSTTDGGYNVLWLAASLFEFNIETTKHEAGYPYLIYHAGEIFDVIGEKGELWLAKNQDDESDQVGWIWSKHFAKLADS